MQNKKINQTYIKYQIYCIKIMIYGSIFYSKYRIIIYKKITNKITYKNDNNNNETIIDNRSKISEDII